MLKHIPSILSPELMKVLMEMGHGDESVLSDGNFPAASLAQRLVRCDGHGIPELLDAVMKFFPLDYAVGEPVMLMAPPANACAIVATGERARFANIILKKGIVREDEVD